jgi:hypothetical protein
MPNNRFSPKVKEIISHSREEALKFGHDYIGTEHLLLGVLREPSSLAVRVLESLHIDSSQLSEAIEDSINNHADKLPTAYNIGNLPLTKQLLFARGRIVFDSIPIQGTLFCAVSALNSPDHPLGRVEDPNRL